MRHVFALALIFLYSCGDLDVRGVEWSAPVVEDTVSSQVQDFQHPEQLFSVEDAENILGETARLQDSATEHDNGVAIYRCTYAALGKPVSGNKRRLIFFMFEEYETAAAAHGIYAGIKRANQNHTGLQVVNLGDEGYFHSDNKNFYFIMARKGRRMFRIKATKISNSTSVDGFNRIAAQIMQQL